MSGIDKDILVDKRYFPVNDWNFLEAWIDPMQSPPYILLLLGTRDGNCRLKTLIKLSLLKEIDIAIKRMNPEPSKERYQPYG
ncbi:MAG: hypothetical protein AAFZ17_01660 [Cyanobacteria bacterium J06650_10]